MIRVDRLSRALAAAASESGFTLLLVAEDGSPIAASDCLEETQTIGAAAASIFVEYKATEKVCGSPLTSFVFASKKRKVVCMQFATLQDGGAILVVGTGEDDCDRLTAMVKKVSLDLQFLVPVFDKMSRRVVE